MSTTATPADGAADRKPFAASMRQSDAPVKEPTCVFTSRMRARLQQRSVCDEN